METLLDVNVILDICAQRAGIWAKSLSAFEHACQLGRVWAYTGSVQTVHNVLASQILTETPSLSRKEAERDSRELLIAFLQGVNWLAALAGDGNVFDEEDPENAQLVRAVARLGPDARLLTRDEHLLVLCPQAISPADFLALPAKNAPLAFIDLKPQQDRLRPQIESGIHRVLHHGQYIMGPEIAELEQRLAEYIGAKHCISVASGTDSLLIAMMALGISAGDEVISVAYTWISPAETIVLLGARPVFVDVDRDTCNMNPAQLEAAITPRTKAIMPISIYGQCADMDAINAIAEKYRLPVIEDAAQSFGATYKGRKSCALSTIGSTSFFPTKPLGCYGDGGALFTDDDELADRMRQIRLHGQKKKHHHPVIGVNGRFDTLQAAIVLAKLESFEEEVMRRAQIGARYTSLLSHSQLSTINSQLQLPRIAPENISVYAQYTVQVEGRDGVQAALKGKGIPSVAYYAVPLHLQPALAYLGHKPGDFPITEMISDRCLSLPMNAYLQQDVQQKIAEVLATALSRVDEG